MKYFRNWLSALSGCLMLASIPSAVLATIVTVETPLGSFEIRLFDADAPVTVANFLKYINDGDYADTYLHRSVPGFIVQGGGFFVGTQFGTVPKDAPIINEFMHPNVRGTIAMAKSEGNPDSATSQWFINVSDNSAGMPNDLDNQNGGFTAFGEVIGNGMDVVDAIDALTVYDLTSIPILASFPLTDVPLDGIDPVTLIFIPDEQLIFTTITINTVPLPAWFSVIHLYLINE